MARSKPRKAKVEKARQERRAEHLEHRIRKDLVLFLHDVTASILQACPPERREDPMGVEEIYQWFDSDPNAPVILCTHPLGAAKDSLKFRIAVNRHGVERELRARGIDESHPNWENAVDVVGPTLRDMTAELLKEGVSLLSKEMPAQLGTFPTD